MKTPTVEVKWIPDRSNILVQVILRIGDEERDTRLGIGATLAEAFEGVARDIRRHAEHTDEKRMREILRDPG